jgi:hypothetical protein
MKITAKRFEIHALPDALRRAGWESLLRRWSGMIITYTTSGDEDVEDDVPYWYGERPLTGLLAAAAWRQRGSGWSLEEFAGLRGKRLKTTSGRGDLWLGLGSRTYTIEAKVKWLSSGADQALKDARAALTAARKQLWKLSASYRSGTLIAICYLVPCPMANQADATPPRQGEILAAVKRHFAGSRSIVASYYPHWDPPEDEDGRIYPGVVLIGRVVSWGTNPDGGG